MIAVIYARYSSDKQTERSIEGQLKVCYEFSKRNNLTVLKEYVDRAQTGKNDNRACLRKMLVDSKRRQFDMVVVYAFDRFGRNLLQSLNNEKRLNDSGVILLSATEPNDDTPAGRMQRNIQMTFAQYFSEELAQKVTRGMELKAEKCESYGGRIPLGYKIVENKYVIDEVTAPIVREIFERYANGSSIKELYDDLNNRGIVTSRGSRFNKNSMHTMLRNRKYLGIYIYKGIETPGGMPQIVHEETFNKVADKLVDNKKAPARSKAKVEYILTTKLFCGHCHEMMIGHSSSKINKNGIRYNYYKCKNAGSGKVCKKKMVHKDIIEDKVVTECMKLLSEDNIKRIAKEIVKVAESYDDSTEIKRLEKSIQECNKAKKNNMDTLDICENNDVRAMIINNLSKIAEDIKSLEKQLEIENARRYIISEKTVHGNSI